MDLRQCHLHRVMVTDGQGLWEDGSERRDPRHLVVYGRAPEVGSRLAQGHWFSQVNKKKAVCPGQTLTISLLSPYAAWKSKVVAEPGTTELWSRDPATTILQQQTREKVPSSPGCDTLCTCTLGPGLSPQLIWVC